MEGRLMLSLTPQMVLDINPGIAPSLPSQSQMVTIGSISYFAADDGVHGVELWKSDGTAGGTTLVKDIDPGTHREYDYYGNWSYVPNSSGLNDLTNVNGTLFFTASGSGLWKSDGTDAGTTLVKVINTGGNNAGVANLTNVNGTLFFTAYNDTNGRELWKSDGTTGGTVMVKDIFPGQYRGAYMYYPNSSAPSNLTNVNGTLFFSADTSYGYGRELWKSDGTPSGTLRVKDINPGSAGSGPSWLTDVNGTLFFAANGTTGAGLWKSDGTEAGTSLVVDRVLASNLTNVNGTLFFQSGPQLWKSDGTAAGTVMLKVIQTVVWNNWSDLTNVNGTLFFGAGNANGHELWKSDGTAAGTVPVANLDPGNLTNVNGTLFFSTLFFTDGLPDGAVWKSDGTAAGTVPLATLIASNLTNVNGTLFFAAEDGIHGSELWKLVDEPGQGTSLAVSGFPATLTAGVDGSFTVTARNADGSTNTSYRGAVRFTSSDPQAVLPATYSFTAADQGVHTFSAILKTAGSQSITSSDTIVPGTAGTQAGITVNPAAASSFTVAGFPSPVTAGVAGSLTVTAQDPFGNRASYTGTVRFTSSDAQAVLPGNYTFAAADAGLRTFSATLKTAGNQVLTATDIANAALTGVQGSILVNSAAASRLVLSAPASVKANTAFSLTVTVVDAYGNVATGYRGTLVLSSSGAPANLPKNYTFTADDQGVHTFTGLRLRKKGTQTVTVTDTLNSSLTGTVFIDVL